MRPLTPPVRVDCYVTDRCNLSCGFCYYKDASRRFLSSGQGDLSGEEAEKMFLLALCLLLHQENGDEGLLMAMMYLLT